MLVVGAGDQVVKNIKPFSLRNHSGVSIRSGDFSGQHVVFCCVALGTLAAFASKTNKLAQLVSRLGSRNTRVVLITQAGHLANQDFAMRVGGSIDVLLDADGAVSKMLRSICDLGRVDCQASFFVLGAMGKLVKWWNAGDLEDGLEALNDYSSAKRLIGDRVPDVPIQQLEHGEVLTRSSGEWFAEKRVVVFGVPGAFTPVCNLEHLPGYIAAAGEMRARGVDQVVCIAVNDAYVMDAWARATKTSSKVAMLADGSGRFTRGMGLSLDLGDAGLGARSRRYAMVVEGGVIIHMNVEAGFDVRVSGANSILQLLNH